MKTATLLLLIGSCMLTPALAADPSTKKFQTSSDMKNMKLGLWESTIESQSPAPDIDRVTLGLPTMTPEERARMEEELERLQAEYVKNGHVINTTETGRYCLKPTDLQKDFVSDELSSYDYKDCKTTEGRRSASSASLRIDCKSPELGQFVWEMTYAVKSPNEVFAIKASKSTSMRKPNAMGKPNERSSKVSSRWVSAACGKVTKGPGMK